MVFRFRFTATEILIWAILFLTILKHFFCAALTFFISSIVASIFISEVNFETAYFSGNNQPISWTWQKLKLNVLNCIIGICGVKYLCKIAHAWGASFTKKLVFLKLSIFFILRNNYILAKKSRFLKVREKQR